MDEFDGKTAVVTGAASGIGRALAERLAAEHMRVVLADVEDAPLREVEETLLERGADVLAVHTDVRSAESVAELERRAAEAFGHVHVLCNNAGVSTGGLAWELTLADWEWTLGVNLWGAIHGVRAFLPAMISHGEGGHIVNTASVGGLFTAPFQAAYLVSKSAIVTLSESLFYELKQVGADIGVSVLCPGFVNTRIIDAARNLPPEYGAPPAPAQDEAAAALRAAMAASMPPAEVADAAVRAIRAQQLYVLTHHEFDPFISQRTDAILHGTAPPTLGFA